MPEPPACIAATENWVKQVIVAHNLCPFSRREVARGSIRYAAVEASQPKAVLKALLAECALLDDDLQVETTLVVLPRGFEDFYRYLDLLGRAEDALDAHGYEGTYQLASFHPDYRFDGEPEDDAAHYTNRSPYPTLHILREASLEAALERYPDPEAIPERNIDYVREQGSAFFAGLLASCHPRSS
ncbi:MAG: DUF1415 domain-containing protein [Halomonas subglaciescola]|nr:DUF1415 domain-containing protein [Halomonas subglaciescola]